MPRSMTGFGMGRSADGAHVYAVEIRTVNHRYCDVRCHLPADLAWLGARLEARVRATIQRGRVELTVQASFADDATVLPVVDLARARGYQQALLQLAAALGLPPELSLTQIAQAPGVVRAEARGDEEAVERAILVALDDAVASVLAMRDREGAALSEVLQGHLERVGSLVGRVREEVPRANADRQRRLRERLEQLVGDLNLDPARLAQEAAVLADRADVTEEIERLGSHVDQFAAILALAEPVGRKLDFLVQEMNREANTIGSKAGDAPLAYLVVDLKTELERIREQVQNIE